MTDPLDPEDSTSSDRAEAALRRALHAHAANVTVDAPDVGRVRRAARRRSRWRSAGIAAAVLAAVAGSTGAVLATTGGTGNEAAGPAVAFSALDASVPQGWRWEYYRDIEVAVPANWRHGIEPGSDWCVSNVPTHPYVAYDLPDRTSLLVGCSDGNGGIADEPPPDTWVNHVVLSQRSPSDHAGVSHVGGWTITKRAVHDVIIKVVSRNPQLGQRILSTARVIDRTPQGCAARSAIQRHEYQNPSPAFDVTALHEVSRIVVCQYDLGTALPQPGFVAQVVLTGATADRELAALQQAPAGGGPNHPSDCGRSDVGSTAIVLHLDARGTTHTMYAYYSSCRGNGTRDGTTVRALTSRSCPPLLDHPPVYLDGDFDPGIARVCP